jgi:integrase
VGNYGDGFIRERPSKSGIRHQAVWQASNGRSVALTFGTRAEAAAHLKRQKALKVLGKSPEGSQKTFREVFVEWSESYVPFNYKGEDSRRGVVRYGERNLLPYFGRKRIGHVTSALIPDWVKWCEGRKVSEWSVRESYTVLRSVVGFAKEVGYVSDFPFSRATRKLIPNPQPTERHLLTMSQVGELADAVPRDLRAFVLLCAFTGCRPSEALALTVGDVDLKKGSAQLNKAAVRGQLQRGLKNAKERRIDLPEKVVLALKEHIAASLPSASPRALLFPSRAGTHRHETNVNTTFRTKAAAIGLDVCVYDLKRFALTFLVETVGPRYAQEQAGHRSSRPTMEIFARVSEEGRRAARTRVDQVLAGESLESQPMREAIARIKTSYQAPDGR